ncbi:hypothetical protein H310_08615 [Aphanomyces invadans]|uniref:Apple domain-containing protein n=1 Tax=Aphanomyces invadans TaxID=157072 RepID=A0A024TWY4_9STRA|nr:hypothetical protein H310_08615 [Aphanomyces invadans]ETV98474.1 hypothetical protein H310_08615 [Aphanomyces invadans]|eukprot:XP_008872671.1 hypothetical protein H310_08615 [Aphanomyces invadans]
MVSCKLPPQSWVMYKGINLFGDTLASPANVKSIDECVQLCQQNPQCNSASYTGYYPTCELKTTAKTFQYAISKAVDLKAFSAMVHNYKFCRAEADLFGIGDVFDFKGSFQDCAKCIDTTKGTNAFTWTAGPTGYYTVPLEEFGHCYCKKIDSFDPAALGYTQGVFCHDG